MDEGTVGLLPELPETVAPRRFLQRNPILEFALPTIVEMCWDQIRLSVIVTPNDLTRLTSLGVTFFSRYMRVRLRWPRWILMISHLVVSVVIGK